MRLPDHLHLRPYAEWNHLVRGLMEAWEVARLLSREDEFEQQVAEDRDGRLIEWLGEMGNASAARALDLGRLEQARTPAEIPLLQRLNAGP